MHKSAKNKRVTTNKADRDSAQNKTSQLPTDDSTNTIEVSNSNKLNNKLNNKLTQGDVELTEIVAVWPELPEHIKAAIKALVQTQNTEKK